MSDDSIRLLCSVFICLCIYALDDGELQVKVAVVGGRDFFDYKYMERVLNSFHSEFGINMIISGGASGADELAYKYAVKYGITFVCHPPRSEDGYPQKFFRRNVRIANQCDAMIAFPTKNSKGTWHSVKKAKQLSKKVWVKQK